MEIQVIPQVNLTQRVFSNELKYKKYRWDFSHLFLFEVFDNYKSKICMHLRKSSSFFFQYTCNF